MSERSEIRFERKIVRIGLSKTICAAFGGGTESVMIKNKVVICGVDTSKLKVLTDKEKNELLIRTKNGDPQARKELIDGNLKLVLSVVRRFMLRCDSPDDLFQVGCIGLIKAVDNFNTELGVKFSTYAVPMNMPT